MSSASGFPQPGRAGTFQQLVAEVAGCTICPRMSGQRPVLNHSSGALTARVMVVAEAPGRYGAAINGVPLSGDASGRNFERLLENAGIERRTLFITNAVLCNPLDHRGN